MTAQPYGPGPRLAPQKIRASLHADRSPRNIRACLPEDDHAAFDAGYREALRRAADELDLTPVHECVESWRWLAILKADPADYARMMQTADRVQQLAERGEPSGGIAFDDAFAERLRARVTRA
ncbi:hypothetical protein GCM10009555_012420 [Acrocarpospora macrocephala]|uniref:Uncharacterized protein n=1 Tax=Acrocarpospora macrocephala TaxID=150177 RepID=A0A5M3X3X6_9ACTN|nr:DUF6247 family protein [Acrocarpospora macrocephala]GES16465.1 hypothetical protein Amac_100630 [Acrocarpospora macrocephala]